MPERVEEDIATSSHILAINGGSSSLKFAVFLRSSQDQLHRVHAGRIERIGLSDPQFILEPGKRQARIDAPDLQSAADFFIGWLGRELGLQSIKAIGHRVVHGGNQYSATEAVSPVLIKALQGIIPMDPNHLPGQIALLEAFRAIDPSLPQFACFDTAFHHDMPRVAQLVPIPRRYQAAGVRRYGFHGISYSYLMQELATIAGTEAARGRTILAHLGSGASLAAVHEGRSIETTMGFTPCSGIVMSTRTGDLDPGLPAFLARAEGMNAEAFDRMVTKESGLLGVSESSPDIRDLIAIQHNDPRAADAVSLFCYRIKMAIGSLAAALGGLDTLVFSGGIGENSPEVRERALEGLEFLGIHLDHKQNAENAAVLSSDHSAIVIRMIRTDEEVMIARTINDLIAE